MRILIIPTTPLIKEGITTVIMSYLNNIDVDNFSFDLIVNGEISNSIKNEILNYNLDLYYLPKRNKDNLSYLKELYKLLKINKYDAVHVHGNSGTMALEITITRIAKVPVRIAHSHNSTNKYKIIHKVTKPILNFNMTKGLACSRIAGKWAFYNNFEVLNNGIKIDDFKFNKTIREKYRDDLNLKNKFVIGHVGHMSYQKNHEFLLKVFQEINKQNKDSILLLIGDGDEKNNIKDQINKYNLNDSVVILGRRNDVNNLFQAMDVFVLPSRYEGLGIVNIEAQAAGLKCVVSDAVPEEAKISDNIVFLSLNNPIILWAKKIIEIKESNLLNERSTSINMYDYSIDETILQLERVYLNNW